MRFYTDIEKNNDEYAKIRAASEQKALLLANIQ
jgi:hypothetical protein